MKRAVLAVTNDLVSDQRVHKMAMTLKKSGTVPLLVGRKLKNSPELKARSYKTKRMCLLFTKGPFFYAEFNFRLFFVLLFTKTDIIVANDLDTLLACFLAARLKGAKLIYDSHEYFTEVPELIDRKFARNTWLRIERWILPSLKYSSTVCASLAAEYKRKYGIGMRVIRNVPVSADIKPDTGDRWKIGNRRMILYQGALNVGRGLEHAISAMTHFENTVLVLAGDGDIREQLLEQVMRENVSERVIFTGRIPFEELQGLTMQAAVGLSIEQNLGLNYYFALPNKLFDYIHAGVPVLVSDLPEMSKVVHEFNIGMVLHKHNTETLVEKLKTMLNDQAQRKLWKDNLKIAAAELCWEKEEQQVLEMLAG